jgi:multidrug efflux system outer membrane protein
MNKNLFLLLLGVLLIPAGCTLEPKYDQPKAPVPAAWPAGPAYPQTVATTNIPSATQITWLEFFSDPKLQQVIGIALTNSRDLRLAALNVAEAQALYGVQRAQLLPAVDATASASRQRVPGDVLFAGQQTNAMKGITYSEYSVNLGVLSWEIDFFGRIRSLKDRALQEFLASEEARRSAQTLLVSSVANAYLTLAADRDNLALSGTTLAAQQASYDLVKRRFDLGLAPELDLYRAESQVAAARGGVIQFTQIVAQDQNALTLLAGVPITEDLLPAQLANVAPPTAISAGLSSEVLLERPDVLEAEHQLRAVYADIGAARAAFFPQISLTAAAGTASTDLSHLFKAGQGTWSYAPQVVLPIFDARTWSALKASKVQKQIAVSQYEQAIQNAFREVADALATRGTIGQQVAAQEEFVNAVAETYRLSLSRYERGIDNYLSVLDAQRSLYAAQQGLVGVRLIDMCSRVRLYAVLGGGWQNPKPATLAAGPALKQP